MRWNIVAIAALGLALSIGGVPAVAGGADGGPLQGDGFVLTKNPTNHTVTIGSQVFRVTPSTTLEDLAGKRMSFAEIATQAGGASPGHMFMYHFEAVARNGAPVLRLLRMVRIPQ